MKKGMSKRRESPGEPASRFVLENGDFKVQHSPTRMADSDSRKALFGNPSVRARGSAEEGQDDETREG